MKQIKLTKKQELVLNYIKEYTAKHGFPPAVREIAKGVGLNSPSSVHSHIKRLERDGFIKKTNSYKIMYFYEGYKHYRKRLFCQAIIIMFLNITY